MSCVQIDVLLLASMLWVQYRRLQYCNRHVLESYLTGVSTSGTTQCSVDDLNTAAARHVSDHVDKECSRRDSTTVLMFQAASGASLSYSTDYVSGVEWKRRGGREMEKKGDGCKKHQTRALFVAYGLPQ